jgi:DNA polymerase (family 10)
MISINPDAHRMENMEYAELGVRMARKGWCESRNILNTHSLKDVQDILGRKRPQ